MSPQISDSFYINTVFIILHVGVHLHIVQYLMACSTVNPLFIDFKKAYESGDKYCTMRRLFIDFEKAYDSFRGEALYNIVIEFHIPTKLVGLIKMYLNITYSKVHTDKYMSGVLSIQNDLEQGDVHRYCF
jgi:hypothetical protein